MAAKKTKENFKSFHFLPYTKHYLQVQWNKFQFY